MSKTTFSGPIPVGNATRRFADPERLPGTTLWSDQVLPYVEFLDAIDGQIVRPTDYRHHRALVLAFVHDRCPECAAWTQQTLEAVTGRSDAEVRVVAPRVGPGRSQRLLWLDPHVPRGRLLTNPNAPALLILDRYGAIQEATIAEDHRLPEPGQVVATLNHLAVLCPVQRVSGRP